MIHPASLLRGGLADAALSGGGGPAHRHGACRRSSATARIAWSDRCRAHPRRGVLIATNGYTDGAVPWLRQRVMPIGSYIVATEPMSEELARSISPRGRTFFDSKNFLYYWHVNAERRLIFGGRASFVPTSVEPDGSDPRRGARAGSPAGGAPAHRLRVGRERRLHVRPAAAPRRARRHPLRAGVLRQRAGAGHDVRPDDGRASRRGHRTSRTSRARSSRSPSRARPFVPACIAAGPGSCRLAGEWFRLADRWSRRGTRPPAR